MQLLFRIVRFSAQLAPVVPVVFVVPVVPVVLFVPVVPTLTAIYCKTAGGADGTALLYSHLLPSALNLVSPVGCIYLIAIEQNKLDQIEKWLRARQYKCETIIKRKAGRELLFLIKITKD